MAVRRTNATVRGADRNGGGSAGLLTWKTFLFCLLTLALPGLARAQDSLRIESVGLGDYYLYEEPTAVRVHIPAASHAQSIELKFILRSGNNSARREISREDRFSEHVEGAAGQPLDVEAPILIPQAGWIELEVTAATADGHAIGSARRDLKELRPLANGPYLVAIFCTDDATCRSVQSQIAFGENGSARSQMDSNLRLTTFRDARAEWWEYAPAKTVVLAGPISGFSNGELDALEKFTRDGGTLYLLEEETADKDFLGAYRQGAANPVVIRVGRGRLFRVRSAGSQDFGRILAPDRRIFHQSPLLPSQGTTVPLLNRIGVAFSFPRLRWLTIWLTIYLLVVGPLNFAILRRMKRLEWGWASVCVLAALFTGSFYFSGSARRPKNYTIDNATIYSLDDRSPVAVEHVGLRTTAPERADIQISVNDDVLVAPYGGAQSGPSQGEQGVDIGAAMTDQARIQQGWDLGLGPPVIIRTPMLRWSFQDWYFEGFHKFPGTVHWTAAGKLKNETGVSFREAAYFDFTANRQYLFSQVAAGQEIDLAGASVSEIWVRTQLPNNQNQEVLRYQEQQFRSEISGRNLPFSLAELPSWAIQIPKAGQVFAGVSDEPVPAAELQPSGAHRAATAVTVVYLGEK
jgi:hypothetical protein